MSTPETPSSYTSTSTSTSTSTPPPLTLILLSTTILLPLLPILYNAFLSPLRTIPGPPISRLTPLWIWYHSYLGHEARLLTSLHAQHGPIIRIGPRECVISDGAALHAIYAERGGFRKADCYANFDFEGHATVFSARDGEYRARRRRAVGALFSTGNIRAGRGRIEGCVGRFVERMRDEARTGEAVDVLNLCRSLALDAVSSFLFGRSDGGVEERSGRLSASGFVDSVVASGRFFYLPHWLFVIVEAVRAKLAPSAGASAEAGGAYFDEFVRGLVADTPPGEETYQGRLKKAGVGDDENAVQLMDLMFAGTDSTGTILSKLIWRLAKNPEVYKRLREEIMQADLEDPTHSYNPQSLKYLDAVVREGLRMGMSTPTRLPRVVPRGGWSYNGHYLPEGTQVGCQSYTLHFNPAVFKDPHAFIPERWLDDPSPEMHRDWFAFSLGARGCLARNLAQTELLLAIQAVARGGILEGASAVGEEIEIFEWFSSALVTEKLELIWS